MMLNPPQKRGPPMDGNDPRKRAYLMPHHQLAQMTPQLHPQMHPQMPPHMSPHMPQQM